MLQGEAFFTSLALQGESSVTSLVPLVENSFTSLVIQEEVRCKGSSPKAPPPVPGVTIDVRGRVRGERRRSGGGRRSAGERDRERGRQIERKMNRDGQRKGGRGSTLTALSTTYDERPGLVMHHI